MMHDTIIYNAKIVDGTGAKGYSADIALANGRIVKIGRLDRHAAKNEISATGIYIFRTSFVVTTAIFISLI